MQVVITGAKILAVALLTGFGVAMLYHNMRDPAGMGISVALLVVALLLYQVWFWRK